MTDDGGSPARRAEHDDHGFGAMRVGGTGVVLIIAYKILAIAVVFYSLAMLWPFPTPNLTPPGAAREEAGAAVRDPAPVAASDQGDTEVQTQDTTVPAMVGAAAAAADSAFVPLWLACRPGLIELSTQLSAARDYSAIPKCVHLFGRDVLLWDEHRLLYLVLLAGALGALIHSLRSLAMYVGNRELRWRWVPYLVLLPFGGAALALVFYVVIRGGFSAPGADFTETNPFGFVAVAALVGMFSQAAILKLQKIADNIFERPEQEKDPLSGGASETQAAEIKQLERKAQVEGAREDIVQITGAGFTETTAVQINGRPRPAVFEGSQQLTVTLEAADLAVLENGGDLRFVVLNGEAASNEMVLS